MTDLDTIRTADPGSCELLDALERLIDAGLYQEAEVILDERERELAGPRKYRQTWRLWEGARMENTNHKRK